MVVILNKNANESKVQSLVEKLCRFGVEVKRIDGENESVLVLVGDTSGIDADAVKSYDFVDAVTRVSEPFKNVSRRNHPDDTVIDICGNKIGGGNFQFIAGPCSIESSEQICSIAEDVKNAGASILRGGAFKPRTSPYAFQGMRNEGIALLEEAKKRTGLPVVTEIMDVSHLPLFENVDIIQVGARNMQNYELLKELGHTDKPVLLKRGLSATVQELLMSAEYIMAGGNDKIILCERGIRTFEQSTRNTLDVSAVAVLKEKTHLPVIADPSHAAGVSSLIRPLALAAAAAGADGLMIEVHNDPSRALCDGPQAITPDSFAEIVKTVKAIREVVLNGNS